jgi:hypothetical protein
MSLNAHVYRRFQSLPPDLVAAGLKLVDPATGETDFPDGLTLDQVDAMLKAQFAAEEWLGSMYGVGELRAEIETKFPLCSILLTRGVYNGIHCADYLPAECMEQLTREVTELASRENEISPNLAHFLRIMKKLLAVSEAEGNPIGF